MPTSRLRPSRESNRQQLEEIASFAAAAALAIFALIRFRQVILTFFVLDDFWVMRDAARISLHSPGDIAQFFHLAHPGFLLYRPLSTTAYAYLLQALFNYDSSGYHAFQLLVMAFNTVLAYAIARRLTASTAAGFAVGVLYLLAPGQAVNAAWLSAFTVTGTAVWVLLMMWAWLAIDATRWRAGICAALQILGLLASEHAVTGPALLAVLSLARGEDRRRVAAALPPVAAPVALYAGAKLWYLLNWPPQSAAYRIAFDPVVSLQRLGQYFTAAFNVLKLATPGEHAALLLGAALVAFFFMAVWRVRTGKAEWRLVAAGLALFATALFPVVVLRAHYYDHYVCLAALGADLALVGFCQVATSTHWRALACALAMVLVAVDLASGERAWRQDPVFRFVVDGSRFNIPWVERTQQAVHDGADTVWVPANTATGALFTIGQIHTYFPGMPATVRRFSPDRPPAGLPPGQVIVRGRIELKRIPEPSLAHPPPGWDPRWDWLRRFAGTSP